VTMRHALVTILVVIGTTACGGEFAAGIDRCIARVSNRDVALCVGDQCYSLPASSPLTGAQDAATERDAAASSAPLAVFQKPTMLYFTQAGCGPCKKVEQLQKEPNIAKWLRNGFDFRKLDIRQAGSVYDVYRTPTHVVIAGGKEIMRFGYVVSAADYARKLDAAWRAAGGKR